MSSIIQNPKTYTHHELENIFFRPMLSGKSAEELGIRVLYNMPMPTTVQLLDKPEDVLVPMDGATSWKGGKRSVLYQKTIPMTRVKAENAFAASDYFSTVFELIASSSGVNMEDLTGTELEAAETELFRKAIAASISMGLWLGDTSGSYNSGYTAFDGILKLITERSADELNEKATDLSTQLEQKSVVELFDQIIEAASPRMRGLYGEGQTALFVSSGIYRLYEKWLDEHHSAAAYTDIQTGRQTLMYHGFPLVEVNLEPALSSSTFTKEFIIFTDRRNIVLAVNTADTPGSEVRMWYNPDEMENRQRAVFSIGVELLDDALTSVYIDEQ